VKVVFAVLAYLVGAIPTGYLLFKLTEEKDIRDFGSRNTGATNVLRLKGWKYAIPVALFDVLKGFLPAFLAVILFRDPRLALIASFLAVLGHCFPVYIRFRGGKGVAVTIGAFAGVAFRPFLLSAGVFVLIVVLSRYVSLGSIIATLSFPFWVLLFHGKPMTAVWGIAIASLVILKHSGNIRRLLKGQERKFGERVS
jgi:acyl phosphate:glycerol-3-phosphate acyltransferase